MIYSSLAASSGVTLGCPQVWTPTGHIKDGWACPTPTCSLFPRPLAQPHCLERDRQAGVWSRSGARWHRHRACSRSRAEPRRRRRCRGAFNSPKKREGKREVRDVGAAFRGTPQFVSAFTVNNSPAARLSAHLTALLRGNHKDYVSIMLAVRCLLFAAVCARCAVTGRRLFIVTFHLSQSTCTQGYLCSLLHLSDDRDCVLLHDINKQLIITSCVTCKKWSL